MSKVDRHAGSGAQEPADLLFVLANVTPDAMRVKDAPGRYLFVNEAFARLMGKTVHEIIGRTDAALFAGATAQRIALRDEDVRRTESELTFVEDINLPTVSGLEVLRRIKGHPDTRSVPVVVLTTSDAAGDVSEAYRLEGDSDIVKPVDFDKFMGVALNKVAD